VPEQIAVGDGRQPRREDQAQQGGHQGALGEVGPFQAGSTSRAQ
jgi:hypothetical protein